MRTSLLIAAALALAAAAPATAQDTTAVAKDPAPTTATDADVVAVITGSADHATLASALDSAGLVAFNGVVHVIDGVLTPTE